MSHRPSGIVRATRGLGIAAALVAAWLAAAGARGEAAGAGEARAAEGRPTVTREKIGATADGAAVEQFTLDNGRGMTVRVMTYGATLTAVEVPDRAGRRANVTLYLDTPAEYLAGHPMFGCVVGRFANRIGGAKFMLDGAEVRVTANAGANHIHGGRRGFDKVVWKAEPVTGEGTAGVRLSHTSPDGDEGYPGTLRATVTYTVTAAQELKMEYTATTDKPTVVNLTNHAYWNLAGAGEGDVLGHRLMMNAEGTLAVDSALIPSGAIQGVEGTPLDFRSARPIGERIADLAATRGYDHCYVLRKDRPGDLSLAARVTDPSSGRVMEVWTTYPGVQLYTANHLSDRWKAGGKAYQKHGALCLEAQQFPDAPNHANFPSAVLRPGETYRHATVHKFSVEP